MRTGVFGVAMFLLSAVIAAAQVDKPTLSCTIQDAGVAAPGPFPQPGSAGESARLRQAPRGAKRVGKHELRINWSAGVQTFRDKPPYNASLDGVQWSYCGYSSAAGMHLLGKRDAGLFTGVLLNEKTGAVHPGGQEVWYSPNGRYYLASEQPDGQDGPTLKVFRSNGGLVWKGYGGILATDGTSVVADLVGVRWNDQDQVVMEVVLPNGKHQLETLTQHAGSWEWLPKIAH
ncbi:MAG TPA: hypothetical protein VMD92_04150 [Acidobacteriaceae bacterium]|nr:hypothetical protein [Acidobacteriaceae bacterium]